MQVEGLRGRLNETLLPTLTSLLPRNTIDQLLKRNPRKSNSIEHFVEPYIALLATSLPNNFAGIKDLPSDLALDYLKGVSTKHFNNLLFCQAGPASDALWEKIFQCAIDAGDSDIVDFILKGRHAGIDANNQICMRGGDRFTAIEKSSGLHHLLVTKTLVRYGADVNKTYTTSESSGGALEQIFRWEKLHEQFHVDPRLISTLIDAGAIVTQAKLLRLISSRLAEATVLIIRARVGDSSSRWCCGEILSSVIQYLDCGTAQKIIGIMVRFGCDLDLNINRCTCGRADGYHRWSKGALDVAADRGNLDLVRTLLSHGANPTNSTLTHAVKSGSMTMVSFLLDNTQIDVDNVHALSNMTPYSEAVRGKHDRLYQLLEQRGAWLQIREPSRFRAALCAASSVGKIEIVKTLLQTGIHSTTAHGQDVAKGDQLADILGLALKDAAAADETEVGLLLIDAGADTDAGHNILYEALTRRNAELVQALLNIGCSESLSSCLYLAVEWGDRSIIEDLIFLGAPWKTRPEDRINGEDLAKPLISAVKKGDRSLVDLLLDAGAPLNWVDFFHDELPLETAVANDNIGMVRYLLYRGAYPDDESALKVAMRQNTDMFRLLLDKFAERYPRGKKGFGSRLLRRAIREGDLALIEILVRKGMDVGACQEKSDFAETPLGFAIEINESESPTETKILLELGADPNSVVLREKSDGGHFHLTALLVAIETKNTATVKLLISFGASVNFPATRGVKRTPLQQAAEVGAYDILQILLGHGADVHAPPAAQGGGTALQLAAIGGFVGIATVLLEKGAEVDAMPSKVHGRTALEGAAEHGRIDMVGLLLNVGAKTEGSGQRQYERALELAERNGHFAVARFIRSACESRSQSAPMSMVAAGEEEAALGWDVDVPYSFWDSSTS